MTEIIPVPAFADNYIWLLRRGSQASVVDPGDAAPVLNWLAEHDVALASILITHHHRDHVGGVAGLLARFPVPVFGPAGEAIPHITRRLSEGDAIVVPEIGVGLSVIEVPGHTAGHIAYVGDGVLFCGDTLFACGCGRLFEGTAAQMHRSLSRFAELPGETRVYCAHEYTLSNIRFALAVEPSNPALQERERKEREKREQGIPTLPSSIALERATNPFLRSREGAVKAAAERRAGRRLENPVEVLATLREWKNAF
jgi:hydroxyacylglutathione hydrolase